MSGAEIRISIDPSRCVLCGGPNECAMVSRSHEDPVEAGEGDPSGTGEPCWCVGRDFPQALTERATALDRGGSCICRRCLEGKSA